MSSQSGLLAERILDSRAGRESPQRYDRALVVAALTKFAPDLLVIPNLDKAETGIRAVPHRVRHHCGAREVFEPIQVRSPWVALALTPDLLDACRQLEAEIVQVPGPAMVI